MITPKISILMPCYNSSIYLDRSICSVIKQTYDCWELICIDDGSTDNTLDILKQYAEKDFRIKIFTKSNGNYCSAMNFGLNKINGDYFIALGSDDELFPNILSCLVNFLACKDCDLLFFKTVKEVDNELFSDTLTDFKDSSFYIFNDLNFLYSKDIQIFNAIYCRDTSRLYKTSCLNGIKYLGKYGVGADALFCRAFVNYCTKIGSLNKNGYLWHIHSDSLGSTSKFSQNIGYTKDKIYALSSFLEYQFKINVQQAGDKNLVRVLYSYLESFLYHSSFSLSNFFFYKKYIRHASNLKNIFKVKMSKKIYIMRFFPISYRLLRLHL